MEWLFLDSIFSSSISAVFHYDEDEDADLLLCEEDRFGGRDFSVYVNVFLREL